MPDEREDMEKALEVEGVRPTDRATVADPTGADALAAPRDETITDGGLAKPATAPTQFDAEA